MDVRIPPVLQYPTWAGTGVCKFSGRSRQRTAESGERIGAIVMPSPGETAVADGYFPPYPFILLQYFFQLISGSHFDPVSSEQRWHGSSGMIFLGNVT